MVWAVDLQLGDILHDHVCSSVSTGTSRTNSEEGGGGFQRTDVIVKADEGSGELCECLVLMSWPKGLEEQAIPLSPFMTTQMRDPTHLSMSSGTAVVSQAIHL